LQTGDPTVPGVHFGEGNPGTAEIINRRSFMDGEEMTMPLVAALMMFGVCVGLIVGFSMLVWVLSLC